MNTQLTQSSLVEGHVLVFYCCVTNHHKFRSLKQHPFIHYVCESMSQKSMLKSGCQPLSSCQDSLRKSTSELIRTVDRTANFCGFRLRPHFVADSARSPTLFLKATVRSFPNELHLLTISGTVLLVLHIFACLFCHQPEENTQIWDLCE